MKIDRHGKAKVLSTSEIQRLFTSGLFTARDKTLCAVMLYTACRIRECVTLKIAEWLKYYLLGDSYLYFELIHTDKAFYKPIAEQIVATRTYALYKLTII